MQILYRRSAVIYKNYTAEKTEFCYIYIALFAHKLQWQGGPAISTPGYNLREPGSNPDYNFYIFGYKTSFRVGLWIRLESVLVK